MKEQLVSFETAKLAKEKEFNINCNKYTINKKLVGAGNQNGIYNAPTQSLLQKWLREEHKIFVSVLHLCHYIKPYTYEIHVNNDVIEKPHYQKTYKTYEEALEKGLYEALKLIK